MPGGYIVRDANGQALAYVYGRADPTEALQAKTLTTDEARRIAMNIARLLDPAHPASTMEQRRFDGLRLLRQVPAITEVAQLDPTGKEQLRVSRLVDLGDKQTDYSNDPKFTDYSWSEALNR
jgi:hypothetical protein